MSTNLLPMDTGPGSAMSASTPVGTVRLAPRENPLGILYPLLIIIRTFVANLIIIDLALSDNLETNTMLLIHHCPASALGHHGCYTCFAEPTPLPLLWAIEFSHCEGRFLL